MAQARKSKPPADPPVQRVARGLREAALLMLATLGGYLALTLVTYSPADRGWSSSGLREEAENAGGRVGAVISDLVFYLLGYPGYLLPLLAFYAAWWIYARAGRGARMDMAHGVLRGLGLLLTLASSAAIADLHYRSGSLPMPAGAGGVLGRALAESFFSNFSFAGATLFLLAALLVGITWLTDLSWLQLAERTGRLVLAGVQRGAGWIHNLADQRIGQSARDARREKAQQRKAVRGKLEPPRIEPVVSKPQISRRVVKESQGELFAPPVDASLPPLALLDEEESRVQALSDQALEAISRRVEHKLEEFGVEARVVEVHPGPVVTRFEIEPAAGVKVSQVVSLSKDLARALSVISVRVVEVIPGKSTIGIEIPNEHREMVRLSEVLRSSAYDESKSVLSLALGKDIQGKPRVVDLARMPHLLVSGTTGSGKSVAVNAMILSLLFKAKPVDVRLIMIDPKMLELSVYEGIPHLLAPVVTDMGEAFNALQWCVGEMEMRYRRMAALGVRNIVGYNRKIREAQAAGEPIADPLYQPPEADLSVGEGQQDDAADQVRYLEPLPYIVVLVDELADMMMVVGKKVEQLIARLAQKARAAGVHLILATQRPSVDVITGLIKANIPSRIAFQVSSKVDSRTILDQMGAEALLGHGDMLYLPPGTSIPERIHGAFVADDEVHRVVAALKAQGEPDYVEAILNGESDEVAGNGYVEEDDEQDELYDKAVYLVTKSRRASISGVQRHLRIGYNRAARLVEQMERQGVVGPVQPNGQREVLAEAAPE